MDNARADLPTCGKLLGHEQLRTHVTPSQVSAITRADARRAGISMRTLRGPKFTRVLFDLYVPSSVVVTPEVRANAALKVSPPGSYASHFTAAEVWGAAVPGQARTHVSAPEDSSRTQRRGIRAHVANPAASVVTHRGVPVSSPTQTFLDLFGSLGLVDLVVLGDSLVRFGHTIRDALVAAAVRWPGHGSRLARRAAGLVRGGVDSPMESRLRMLIVLARLPEPQVNVILRDGVGNWIVRFDLAYRGLKLVIEYDGRQHAENDAQWQRDIDRRELLDRLGWRLVVVRSTGIYVEPGRTLERIAAALRERGCGSLPGKLDEEWRRYFPERR